MGTEMTDLSPKQCLALVKTDFLYKKNMDSLEDQYYSAPVKDEALKIQLLERANKRMGEAPRCIPLLWEDLHDVIEVITYGWDELVKLGFSSPRLYYSIISLCMLQRIDEWFEEDKKDKRTTALPTVSIPQCCKEAADRIIIPRLFRGSATLDSKQQIGKALQLINPSKGNHLAMLMVICNEAGAIRQGANYHEFVQALIGLGLLPYNNEKAIQSLANKMSKKFNGYTRKGVKSPKLSWHHEEWTKGDKVLGERLYTLFI